MGGAVTCEEAFFLFDIRTSLLCRIHPFKWQNWVPLLVTMFGSTLRCLLFAGLCLSDSYNFPEDQVFFEAQGSPVLRRFNLSSPAQLEKTLNKARVRTQCVIHLGSSLDKLCLRPTASISGKLLPPTSISTSLPTRPDRPSSYHSKTSLCPTLNL